MKIFLLVFISFFINAFVCSAQESGAPSMSMTLTPEMEKSKDSILDFNLEKPTYINGDDQLKSLIKKNLVYPSDYNNVMIAVIVSVKIDKNGNPSNYAINRSAEKSLQLSLKSPSLSPEERTKIEKTLKSFQKYDQEALRVAKLATKFNPAKAKNAPIDGVKFISINFKPNKK